KTSSVNRQVGGHRIAPLSLSALRQVAHCLRAKNSWVLGACVGHVSHLRRSPSLYTAYPAFTLRLCSGQAHWVKLCRAYGAGEGVYGKGEAPDGCALLAEQAQRLAENGEESFLPVDITGL